MPDVISIVDEVAAEAGNVKVGKVNVDEEPALAAKFGVMSIPTLLVFENGKVVKQSIGYIEKMRLWLLFSRAKQSISKIE